ncbi:alkaline shock response membrane anchor protein AmaP [Moorella sulfitireducens (nom. illeg.)]|uniref:alkaline shock response membrane anchor protein AmaP n=1 Tax=Neomoorella sulfitireducens TaxID=2972948 RepID=UPI0021AC7E82
MLDRALLALFALLVAVLSLGTLVVVAGWAVPLDLFELSLRRPDYRIIAGLVATVLFLLALRFLVASVRPAAAREEQAVIKAAELGTASISLPALENLVIRAARQVKGVREVRTRLHVLPEGLSVKLNITVSPDRNLPELAAALQQQVHEYIVATAGLEVPEVQVRVNGIYQEGVRRAE